MRIVISATTWYDEDQDRVLAFEETVRSVAAGHEVVIVPKGDDLHAAMAGAEVFFPLSGHTLTPDVVAAGPCLQWIQMASAGVEHALFPELVERPITVTNAAGVYAIPIAEHVLGMMLAMARGLPDLTLRQARREWKGFRGEELHGATVLVVGLGGIGREVARRCRPFGMGVIATRTQPYNSDADADRVFAASDLTAVLPQADWVVLCAPATPTSEQLIGAEQLAAMKPSARLVNIARGALVDENALIAALREGRIAGAALDVFEDEPLPEASPLWDMPNVFISPHTSGSSPRGLERTLDLFTDNLRRYLSGAPLQNVVDKHRGY